MILSIGGIATVLVRWRKPPMRTVCLVSDIDTQELRGQLDQLRLEADHTRTKANNARLWLMRLSEAAEKLRRQAALNVQTGREDDARELLFQKKKIMQALEKSRSRIALLDELSSKLNEAISYKETQLIENVASDLNIGRQDGSSTVRVISPKDEDEKLNDGEDLDQNAAKFSTEDDQGVQVHTEVEEDDNLTYPLIADIQNKAKSLSKISSYDDLMEHLDLQLNKIEVELVMVLRVSALVLGGGEEKKPENSKVQQVTELLEDVRRIRKRISSIMESQVAGSED